MRVKKGGGRKSHRHCRPGFISTRHLRRICAECEPPWAEWRRRGLKPIKKRRTTREKRKKKSFILSIFLFSLLLLLLLAARTQRIDPAKSERAGKKRESRGQEILSKREGGGGYKTHTRHKSNNSTSTDTSNDAKISFKKARPGQLRFLLPSILPREREREKKMLLHSFLLSILGPSILLVVEKRRKKKEKRMANKVRNMDPSALPYFLFLPSCRNRSDRRIKTQFRVTWNFLLFLFESICPLKKKESCQRIVRRGAPFSRDPNGIRKYSTQTIPLSFSNRT